MLVFDRVLHSRRRARARAGFPEHGFLFMEGAERLFDRLMDVRRDFPLALDLGCRMGWMAETLKDKGRVGTLLQADLAPELAAAAGRLGPAFAADEEWLPVKDASLDLVLSNLNLHWVNDLPGALSQIRRALRPDGLILASMLGGETLKELREVLADAEIALDGGLSPRVSPFADVRDLGGLLQRAGFALPVVDAETVTVSYADPMRLLADLRGMGETNVLLERRRQPFRRQTLFSALEKYRQRFEGSDGRVPATFQILTMTAWAPAASQQKPLKPGAATGRLADALDTQEISLGDKADPGADPGRR
ncbi:MAG: methyltransferase domain-containing protein [Proteobacteria bacterium]|nr:methyltransferase domain-containing protein [Pseudomonadota bacterium]